MQQRNKRPYVIKITIREKIGGKFFATKNSGGEKSKKF
jgi:hypothetical protein